MPNHAASETANIHWFRISFKFVKSTFRQQILPNCWLNVKNKFFMKICIKKFPTSFFFHRMDCLATNSVWNKNYSAMMRYDKTAHHGRSWVLFRLERFGCRFKFFPKLNFLLIERMHDTVIIVFKRSHTTTFFVGGGR